MTLIARRFIGVIAVLLMPFGLSSLVFAEPVATKEPQLPPLVTLFLSWRNVQEMVTTEDVKLFLPQISAAIDAGAHVNVFDHYGNSPLLLASYWAAWHSDGVLFNDIVTLLLAKGADPNLTRGPNPLTPLYVAAALGGNDKLIEILCAAGANVNAPMVVPAERAATPLEQARESHWPQIKTAMEKCARSP